MNYRILLVIFLGNCIFCDIPIAYSGTYWYELTKPTELEFSLSEDKYYTIVDLYYRPCVVSRCYMANYFNSPSRKVCYASSRNTLYMYRDDKLERGWKLRNNHYVDTTINREKAIQSQGKHTVKISYQEYEIGTVSHLKEYEIDNTPQNLTAQISGTEGLVDISGTVQFTPRNGGWEGWIDIYHKSPGRNDRVYIGSGGFRGEKKDWTYEYLMGGTTVDKGGGDVWYSGLIDAGSMAQGVHEYTFTAVAYNGTESKDSAIVKLPIDNTPKVIINGTTTKGCEQNGTDIFGTVEFKERFYGKFDGILYLTLIEQGEDGPKPMATYSKAYNQTEDGQKEFTWKYSDLTLYKGRRSCIKSEIASRELTIKAKAVAANGAYVIEEKNVIIPPGGCPIN